MKPYSSSVLPILLYETGSSLVIKASWSDFRG
jgi:hypothetical protein